MKCNTLPTNGKRKTKETIVNLFSNGEKTNENIDLVFIDHCAHTLFFFPSLF
jgi:hypothetical protein